MTLIPGDCYKQNYFVCVHEINQFIYNFDFSVPETTTQSTTAATMKTTMTKLTSVQQQHSDLSTEPGTDSAVITAEDMTSSNFIRTNDKTPLSNQATISDAVASIAQATVENSLTSGKSLSNHY